MVTASATVTRAALQNAERVLRQWHSDTSSHGGGSSRPSSRSSTRSNSSQNTSDTSASLRLWEGSSANVDAYLQALDSIQSVIDTCESGRYGGSSNEAAEMLHRAKWFAAASQPWLEQGFWFILKAHSKPLEPEAVYQAGTRSRMGSSGSVGGRGSKGGSEGGPYLMQPHAAVQVQEVARRMVQAGLGQTCLETYRAVRRQALDRTLEQLAAGQFRVEEIGAVRWEVLEERVKAWMQFARLAVKVVLLAERRLCDSVFHGQGNLSEVCFFEVASSAVRFIFAFADAFALDKRLAERLFSMLDLYELMSSTQGDFNAACRGDGPCMGLRDEFHLVTMRLSTAISAILAEHEKGVERDSSEVPETGTIHSLTRYVVTYLIELYKYRDSLVRLFQQEAEGAGGKNQRLSAGKGKGGGRGGGGSGFRDGRDGGRKRGGGGEGSSSESGSSGSEDVSGSGSESESEGESESEEEVKRREQARREARQGYRGEGLPEYSLLAQKVVWKLRVLEGNLQVKAREYRDPAQGEIFLLNNIHYMAKRVKESNLRIVLGDDWVRQQAAAVRQHAGEYLRCCFSRLTYTLRVDPSVALHKSTLKEKFKVFNIVLEEIHRNQTRWLVNPGSLRDELQQAVKQRVLAPYTDFYLAYKYVMESSRHPGKYLRHDPVEVNEMILDLFVGYRGH